MTLANANPFDASFYFRDMGAGHFDVSVHFEGGEPVYLSNFRIFNAEDRWVGEYENGAILVNPATSTQAFDLARLFPGHVFRRILGSANQDPETNDGSIASARVKIPGMDALFLIKSKHDAPYSGRRMEPGKRPSASMP
ncbi:MAG: hypothetical protein BWZ10_01314 [candidate division BRC1 bacterium ADurb.BinA364]|nr:MAG: hypothetical protein BWZ10_01314 [candidate division BRC1 bacterium ADurb.BinA364]